MLCYGTVAGGFLSSRWLGAPDPEPPYWQDLLDECWQSACDVVWALTGRRLGQCQVTAAFTLGCQATCLPEPLLWRGRWFNVVCQPHTRYRGILAPLVTMDRQIC